MPQEIPLSLTADEVNGVLAAIGQLPTSVGAWPLFAKIQQQFQAHIQQQQKEQK